MPYMKRGNKSDKGCSGTTCGQGGGDAQNVDVDLGHFLDVDCRLKGFKKCRIYNKFFEKKYVDVDLSQFWAQNL